MTGKGGTKGWVDIHAHMLPSVDDGAPDWGETGGTLYKAHRQGITRITTAPHYVSGQDTKRLREMMKRLKETTFSVSEDMMIGLGQGVQYFEKPPSFLEQGKVLVLIGSRYVLVRFLPGDEYVRLFRTIHRLVQLSYLPITVHTERYDCLKERGRMKGLVRCGAYLQMSAGNLGGGLFDRWAAWRRKEILRGNVHFVVTDMHGVVIRPLELERAVRWTTRQDRNGQDARGMAKRLLQQDQEHILRDSVL